ncbi:8921_t:CDS:2, partial [Diversispora eburnea]
KKPNIFKEPNCNFIHVKFSALRPEDLSTIIKEHCEWDKIIDCYIFDSSSAVEIFIEIEYQKCLSVKYFPKILCSLIASTGVILKLILTEDIEKKTVYNLVQSISFRDIDDMNILSDDDVIKVIGTVILSGVNKEKKNQKIKEYGKTLIGFIANHMMEPVL